MTPPQDGLQLRLRRPAGLGGDHPYQNGLLVWYWNEQYADNNVGDHPGGYLILPWTLTRASTTTPTASSCASGCWPTTRPSGPSPRTPSPSQGRSGGDDPVAAAVNVFDDTKSWWSNCDADACTGSHAGRYQPGWTGVDVPKTGTTVTVNGATTGSHLNITVSPKK